MYGYATKKMHDEIMKAFDACPVCGGDLENKQVEKLLRCGGNTDSLKVFADVCLRCGERLYAEDVIRSFEEIRLKLQKNDFHYLKNTGQSFTVDENCPNKAMQPAIVYDSAEGSYKGGKIQT